MVLIDGAIWIVDLIPIWFENKPIIQVIDTVQVVMDGFLPLFPQSQQFHVLLVFWRNKAFNFDSFFGIWQVLVAKKAHLIKELAIKMVVNLVQVVV